MTEKEEWDVKVFRRTINRGWEMYHNTGEESRKDDSRQNIVTATPRTGCVEIKKLRIRIHFSTSTATSTNNSSNEEEKKEPQEVTGNSTVVVRRMDTILLTTRKGGAVVLKFKDVGECLSFSDKLVYLNQDLIPKSPFIEEGYKKEEMPQICFERKRPYFFETEHEKKDYHDTHNKRLKVKEASIQSNYSCSIIPSELACKRIDVISYIVRLLHDDSFMSFVDDIEQSVKSLPDCAKILKQICQGKEDPIDKQKCAPVPVTPNILVGKELKDVIANSISSVFGSEDSNQEGESETKQSPFFL